MLIAVWVIIAKNWKEPKYPSERQTDQQNLKSIQPEIIQQYSEMTCQATKSGFKYILEEL